MKFLLDMGVSPNCGSWLKNKGFDCLHLSELGLHKLHDNQIIELARKEKRIVLTCDTDFGSLLALEKYEYPSIILFRLNNFTPVNICQKLSAILEEINEKQFSDGIFITVKEENYRTRTLPIL
ncbi:MAG: DUF5615 family PIN-like protein [Bacteroidia bacterium]